jgi:hypothetical protein
MSQEPARIDVATLARPLNPGTDPSDALAEVRAASGQFQRFLRGRLPALYRARKARG